MSGGRADSESLARLERDEEQWQVPGRERPKVGGRKRSRK